jgi:type II secretory pathway component PulC
MLAAGGMKPGDVLVSVCGFKFANPFDRKTILTWQFKEDLIKLVYLRDDRLHTSAMDNPKGK